MSYTLRTGQILLGESEMNLPTTRPRALAGSFRPTEAFAAVWPLFRERKSLAERSGQAIETLRPDLPRGEAIRAALMESGVGAASLALEERIRALDLRLLDPAGAPVAAALITVSEMEIPDWPDMPEAVRASMAEDFAQVGMTVAGPNYILLALMEVPGKPAGAGPLPGADPEA